MTMTTQKPGGTTKLTPASDATRLTIMEVAIRLGKRYQKARDMMLARKFGDALYIDNRLTVEATKVDEWLARQAAKPTIQRPEER